MLKWDRQGTQLFFTFFNYVIFRLCLNETWDTTLFCIVSAVFKGNRQGTQLLFTFLIILAFGYAEMGQVGDMTSFHILLYAPLNGASETTCETRY